ncbi:hypothetical protein [Caldalkalibacillus mannanilyticus]|uniref:hypothetical protein n=1 Tax=Caldalkalibacillus mannanilyticus TaxID=1418 RepID=UPI00046A7A49|nr:hypothetical protein [Caldalkalibacillus mannanilyticus]
MYVFVIVFAIITVIYTALSLLVNRKRELIYTAFGYEEYMRIRAKLDKYGISTKTTSPMGLGNRTNPFKNTTQYDIYISKNDKHKAIKALNE